MPEPAHQVAERRPETLRKTTVRRNRRTSGEETRGSAISTARNWWLRSPNPGNANNVRNVNSDGSLNNNNANNGNGAVADCENGSLE